MVRPSFEHLINYISGWTGVPTQVVRPSSQHLINNISGWTMDKVTYIVDFYTFAEDRFRNLLWQIDDRNSIKVVLPKQSHLYLSRTTDTPFRQWLCR